MAYSDRHIADHVIEISLREVKTWREEVEGVEGAFLVHELLTQPECEQLIREFERVGFTPKKSKRKGPPIRTNMRLLYEAHPRLLEVIESRLRAHFRPEDVSSIGSTWRLPTTSALNALWRVNRYQGAERFHPHFDSGFSSVSPRGEFMIERRSLLSIIIYLNSCEEGETVFFPDGQRRDGMPSALRDAREVRVIPRPGSALIFPHYGPLSPRHAGRPAMTTKHIIRSDIAFERSRPTLRELITSSSARPLVLILGPAGAGKTTQARALARALKFEALCFGDLIRATRREDSALGSALRADAQRRDAALGRRSGDPRVPGGFLTDAIAERLLWSGLDAVPEGQGVVIEGFPRSRSQSVMLEVDQLDVLGVISLEVSPSALNQRLDARGREGDEPASRPARDEDWARVTSPLLAHFEKRDQLMIVNAEGSPEEVTRRALSALDQAVNERLMSALPRSFTGEISAELGLEPVGLTAGDRCYQRKPGTRVFQVTPHERPPKTDGVFIKCSVDPVALPEKLKRAPEHFTPLETPKLVAHISADGVSSLATTPVRGDDAKAWARRCASDEERAALCDEVARALRALHDAPLIEDDYALIYDPYHEATRRVSEGVIPLSNFSSKYGVSSPPETQVELRDLFEALGPPPPFTPTRLHGDPCLPNWITREGRVTGVVDVGGLCVGPRGLDVALAAWSVGYNLGPRWRERFLASYCLISAREVDYYAALCRFIS